jgi:hypothetical protein
VIEVGKEYSTKKKEDRLIFPSNPLQLNCYLHHTKIFIIIGAIVLPNFFKNEDNHAFLFLPFFFFCSAED